MYEQEEPVLRRLLMLTLWLVIAVAIVWGVIWLAYFRHHNTRSSLHGTNTQQAQGSKSQKPKSQNGGGSGAGSTARTSGSNTPAPQKGSSGTGSGSSNPAAAQPGQLANAGAGDIFVPFLFASAAGSVYYYVRLHKKLARP